MCSSGSRGPWVLDPGISVWQPWAFRKADHLGAGGLGGVPRSWSGSYPTTGTLLACMDSGTQGGIPAKPPGRGWGFYPD